MTRRTTVIQPSRKTDALYTLPPQPFARRIVSACLFGYLPDDSALTQTPQLKIADVEGNVLAWIQAIMNPIQLTGTAPYTYFWGNNLSEYPSDTQLTGGTPIYVPASIPIDLMIPESNILTIEIFNSQSGDTIPNLVLVTEDQDDEFIY